DSGRVVSRPGTGTVTTGAESGTTRNANCGASPSRAPPSAVATSRRQMPEAAGARRPAKRVPVTASRARAPRPLPLHAAVASGTLAAPVVTITVPSGTRIVSGPATSGSSGRARYAG